MSDKLVDITYLNTNEYLCLNMSNKLPNIMKRIVVLEYVK